MLYKQLKKELINDNYKCKKVQKRALFSWFLCFLIVFVGGKDIFKEIQFSITNIQSLDSFILGPFIYLLVAKLKFKNKKGLANWFRL